MAIPQTKNELLAEINLSYAKLKADLDSVPAQLARKVEMEGHAGGTQMSVHNLVAYLVGWGELVLKWHALKNKGKAVDFPETGYKWNELGKLAQKFYRDYEKLNYPELLAQLDVTVKKLLALVSGYTNEQLYKTPWYEQWTMGRLIQFNSSSPYKNARIRVRKWKKENKV